MPARNEHTGDLIQTKFNTKQYQDNLTAIFGDRPVQKGKFRQCRETGKFIPMDEWLEKYGTPAPPKTPMVICNHFEPYRSPVTERVISSKREHNNELRATGCRVYEGREQEVKEANKWQAEQEAKLEQEIDHTLNETMHEIEHGYRSVND